MMEELYIALAVVFNIFIILFKIDRKQVLNAILDFSLLVGVVFIFSGSEKLLVIGTIASALTSILLWIFPPKFLRKEK